jgi:hypothetical protein
VRVRVRVRVRVQVPVRMRVPVWVRCNVGVATNRSIPVHFQEWTSAVPLQVLFESVVAATQSTPLRTPEEDSGFRL